MGEPLKDDAKRDELERIRRVSDLLCTAHATLRDTYRTRGLIVEVIVLISTFLLTVIALADQNLLMQLLNTTVSAQLGSGIAGSLIFCLTLLQLTLRWKEKAESHEKSFRMYAEVKRESIYTLMQSEPIPEKDFQRLADRYDMAGDVGTAIPEKLFIKLKQRHELKVEVSKAISNKPGASVFLAKVKIFLRDNFGGEKDA